MSTNAPTACSANPAEETGTRSLEHITAIGRTMQALEDAAELPIPGNNAIRECLTLSRTVLYRESPEPEELEKLTTLLHQACQHYYQARNEANPEYPNLRKTLENKYNQCLDAANAVRTLRKSLPELQ